MRLNQYCKGFSICVIIVLLCFSMVSCSKNENSPTTIKSDKKTLSMRIGLALQPSGSLFFVADEKGLFKKHNIDLEIVNYPSGKRALNDGLLKNKVDLITTSEVPFVFSSFKHKDLKILSSIFTADNVNRIIARRDVDIAKPSDLKGKKIGTQKSSAVHYFLHLFLLENNLSDDDINIEFMKAEKLPLALASGKLDGFSMREPYITEAKKQLAENAIIFSEPGIYNQVEVLVTNNAYLENNQEAVERILSALKDAEAYFNDYPSESDEIIARKFNVSVSVAESYRTEVKQRVSLDQSTLLLIESIARWAMKNNMVSGQNMPDYMDFIHYTSLRNIDEKSVTIIH